MSFVDAFQKQDTKILSWSQTMSFGNSFLQYQVSKNVTVRSSVVMVVLVSIIHMSEPEQSLIVKIQLYPSSVGNGSIKSIVMDEPVWEAVL